jgi:hypothetical protein
MKEIIEKLQQKMKSYKKQVDEAVIMSYSLSIITYFEHLILLIL